ncbi:MAG: SAM-dependent methyltransferase [Alcaligenaceae bacterium]|nr:SAM-dependent methyltransferase [Alcaligenaceae bacterium]
MLKSVPYKTAVRTIHLPGQEPLKIFTLSDRQQFYDPTGAAQRLGISSATWPLFGMLWPSGLQLALKVIKNQVDPEQRILEIGCGLALASLTAHRLGADVTASDRHPLTKRFLNKNLKNNDLPLLEYRHGQWGRNEPVSLLDTGAPILSGRYDLIMGSDLLYEPDSPAQVAQFIHQHAQAQSEVWVMDPNRGYRNRFTRKMAEFGFSLMEDAKIQRPYAYNLNDTPEAYSGRFLRYVRNINPRQLG